MPYEGKASPVNAVGAVATIIGGLVAMWAILIIGAAAERSLDGDPEPDPSPREERVRVHLHPKTPTALGFGPRSEERIGGSTASLPHEAGDRVQTSSNGQIVIPPDP